MIRLLTEMSSAIWKKHTLLLVLIVILYSLSLTNACYITNCPWGGKRSINEDYADTELTRSCRKCAGGLGTCFGPRICCGPDIGCLMDTKESVVCRSEDVKSAVPCAPYGKTCNKIEFGKCATANLCCNPEKCVQDAECSVQDDEYTNDAAALDDDDDYESEKKTQELDRKILKALTYLVEKKHRQQQQQGLKLDDKNLLLDDAEEAPLAAKSDQSRRLVIENDK